MQNYNEGVKEGKCFACEERKALWANFPCQHLLWCVDCKTQASLAAGSSIHKCVVCDAHVQRIDVLTCHDYRQLVGQYLFNEDFPPLDPNHLRRYNSLLFLTMRIRKNTHFYFSLLQLVQQEDIASS